MVGIFFAGFLYDNGEGFQQGTIFYIVIAMLVIGATIMWITSTLIEKRNKREIENVIAASLPEKKTASGNEQIYSWFLISLIIIVIGVACVSQVFLLFLKLPEGLAASDQEMSLILMAWTLGGMLTSLSCGWLADKFGRIKILSVGFILAFLTPTFYGLASSIWMMTLIYGLNGVAFWTIQTAGFAFAGDIIPEDKRGRFFSRYNTVMALSWGPAGFLIGGPLTDFQAGNLGLPAYAAYVNTFYVSSIIVAIGTLLFAVKVAKVKAKMN